MTGKDGFMNKIVHNLKRSLPAPARALLGGIVHHLRNRWFKPYLKKKNIEGVAFEFWIADADARDWYDLHCTDPVWLEMRFLKEHMIEQGDVVLECGGHHGCTAIVLSNWAGETGKVVTFEASPKNCDIIEKNIRQNNLGNVTVERKAVGSRKGKITINDVSNASITMTGRGVEVELVCLDEYENLNPSFLKIDVEGFEVQVLQGARRIMSKRPKLAIEIHAEDLPRYGASVEDLFDLIDVDNYRFWIQWEDGKYPEEYRVGTPIRKRAHLFAVPSKR